MEKASPARPFCLFAVIVAVLSLTGIWLYQGNNVRAEQIFFLKYLLSSQAAISLMSAFFFIATGAYWIGLVSRTDSVRRIGSAMTWIAVIMGTVGLFVRWYESYLLGPEIGHIPVSNMYEVFVFFSLIAALLYLYYETRYNTRSLGAFVLPVVSAAVIFLLWFSFTHDAYQIQPLVPDLQSYWLKIHIPANFIGYGGFIIAAMVGIAYLLASQGNLARNLPEPQVLENVMYKAGAIGFTFFTIAIVLGALWAAEAWGSYWQWDPKETWTLLIWQNYALWLFTPLIPNPGMRGRIMAWWAIVELFVVTFGFFSIDLYLSGLHS